MNTTSKLIFTLALTVNVAAIVHISTVSLHQQAVRRAQTVNLGSITVTPSDIETGTVNLGAILVTPTDADWRYAQTHGAHRPAAITIALAPISVQPSAEQLAEVAIAKTPNDAAAMRADTAQDVGTASLVEALETFAPGQYLDADAALRVLNTLVFERAGG